MNKKIIKKVFSLILSLTMIVGIIPINDIVTFADTGTALYTYNGYTVEYTVESEWIGGQSVKIKLINTGTEPILNWCLEYDAEGAVENLYNAVVYSNQGTKYALKHNGYNYEVEPNSSTEFGYILQGDNLSSPTDFVLRNKRVTKENGYTVDFNITSEWDIGFNADITITNVSDKPIEAWTLTLDSNFEISNYWNCKLLNSENGQFTFANQLWTTPIPAGGSASFGISGNKINENSPIAENWLLTEVVIDVDENISSDVSEFLILGFIEYSKDKNALIINWVSEYNNGIFNIMTSYNGVDYQIIDTVTDSDMYEYAITEPFDKKYFKIKQTTYDNKFSESNAMFIENKGNGYGVGIADTDNDSVADYLEEILDLDIGKSDTDEDGLTDYQEIFITNTDPTVFDSVTSGISDAQADSDSDGLSNIYEIQIGTDPTLNDTDYDGVHDGDEVIKYMTNPLDADTDKDYITDGDEIAVGLDPLNPNTFGIPDSEYTFDVTLAEESEAVSDINTPDNEYKLSIELKAAGNVVKNIIVKESSYSEAIRNTAIVGKSFDIEYDNTCKVEEIMLKYQIDDSNVSESDDGLERYCVFKLFEDYNVILPIYTEYNLNSNIISAQVDELGTYCLMDMEKLTNNLSSIYSEGVNENSDDIFGKSRMLKTNAVKVYSSPNTGLSYNIKDKTSINVVFILDNRNNISYDSFEDIKENIVKASAEILKESPKAKIYILLQHSDNGEQGNPAYSMVENKDSLYFTNSEEISDELDYVSTTSNGKYNKHCVLSDAIKYVFDNCDNSNGTYCFSIFDSTDVVYRTTLIGENIDGVDKSDDYGYEVLNKLAENQIDVSVISNISPEYNLGYAIDLYKATGGVYVDGFNNLSDEVLRHIYGYVPEHMELIYNGMNFEELRLKADITYDYVTANAELSKQLEIATGDEIKIIREQFSKYADSDDDGLYDFEELDVQNQMITWKDGKPILPTIQEYCRRVGLNGVTTAYNSLSQGKYSKIFKIYVMPIQSNPMNEDSDGDGLLDGRPQINSKGDIIAPKDYDPNNADGPKGMWLAHINNAKNSRVPEKLAGWYGYTQSEYVDINDRPILKAVVDAIYIGSLFADVCEYSVLDTAKKFNIDTEKAEYIVNITDFKNYFNFYEENNGVEGFAAFVREVDYLVECGLFKVDKAKRIYKDLNSLVPAVISGDKQATAAVQAILSKLSKDITNDIDNFGDNVKIVMASLGSRILNFKADESADLQSGRMLSPVHSQPRSWQAIGGYNNVYDNVFSFGTNGNMAKEKFQFAIEGDDMEYILWTWRGNYLNLGAGAEIGIYSRPKWMHQNSEGLLDHYFVDYKLSKPMNLYLYEYNSSTNIDNVFSWNPEALQWWVTGFNPEYAGRVDVNKLVSVGCVDFAGHEDMYNALRTSIPNKDKRKDFVIFDDENKVMWLCWCREDLLK